MAGKKNHQKLSNRKYRKVINKNDPFDRLIMELGEKGILSVCVVSIGNRQMKDTGHRYSRKPSSPKDKQI